MKADRHRKERPEGLFQAGDMMSRKSFSEPLHTILVFGASGHIGGPLAHWTLKAHPEVTLKLATSRQDSVPELKVQFPRAEIVLCDYYDHESLQAAMENVEGVFMVTPDFTDEVAATTNLVKAAEAAQTVRHIVRLMGDPPGVTLEDVPVSLQKIGDGVGAAVGHQAARRLLDQSFIAVTYVNVLGYYMDDLIGHWYGDSIRDHNTMTEPRRHHMFYVDAAEIGEAAARVLMRRDGADIGRTLELHNAIDLLDFYGVAELLSDELRRQITYVEGPEAWRRWCGPAVERKYGEGMVDYFVEYFSWEAEMVFTIMERDLGGAAGKVARWVFEKGPRRLQNLVVDKLMAGGREPVSHDLEGVLGRKPRSLRAWVRENRASFEPAGTTG
jgi:uncharacterized protein YbjT (DUF2867 family)